MEAFEHNENSAAAVPPQPAASPSEHTTNVRGKSIVEAAVQIRYIPWKRVAHLYTLYTAGDDRLHAIAQP